MPVLLIQYKSSNLRDVINEQPQIAARLASIQNIDVIRAVWHKNIAEFQIFQVPTRKKLLFVLLSVQL